MYMHVCAVNYIRIYSASMNVHVHIYVYVYVCIHVYVYVYACAYGGYKESRDGEITVY